jgi:hypothetical protein
MMPSMSMAMACAPPPMASMSYARRSSIYAEEEAEEEAAICYDGDMDAYGGLPGGPPPEEYSRRPITPPLTPPPPRMTEWAPRACAYQVLEVVGVVVGGGQLRSQEDGDGRPLPVQGMDHSTNPMRPF